MIAKRTTKPGRRFAPSRARFSTPAPCGSAVFGRRCRIKLTADETPLRRLSRYTVALWYIAELLLAALGIWQLSRNSYSAQRLTKSVPLLGTSSAERNQPPQHCLFQAVAHGGGKSILSMFAWPHRTIDSTPSSAWRWGLLLIFCLLAGHVVYWTDMRMRAPIMPVVAILAAAGLPCCRSRDN